LDKDLILSLSKDDSPAWQKGQRSRDRCPFRREATAGMAASGFTRPTIMHFCIPLHGVLCDARGVRPLPHRAARVNRAEVSCMTRPRQLRPVIAVCSKYFEKQMWGGLGSEDKFSRFYFSAAHRANDSNGIGRGIARACRDFCRIESMARRG
jgi:hypothetical protein